MEELDQANQNMEQELINAQADNEKLRKDADDTNKR